MTNLLIIGGTSGLGAEYARFCFRSNFEFTIIAQTKSGEFAESVESCDLAQPNEVQNLLEELIARKSLFDSIVFFQRSRHHTDNEEWAAEIAVQVLATKLILQNSTKLLKGDGRRSIVTVGSTASRFVSDSATDAYQVAKSAQLQLTRIYARKLGPESIRVNAISPFFFIKEETKHYYESKDSWHNLVLNRIPLQKACTSEDIIGGIEFLLGNNSKMITGHELIIDGGVSLSLEADL